MAKPTFWTSLQDLRLIEIGQVWFISVFGWFLCPLMFSGNEFYGLAAILLQIASVFYLNDHFDAHQDAQSRRKSKGKLAGLMLWISAALAFFSLLISLLSPYYLTLALFVALLFSVLYSCPPMRLKERIYFPLAIHFIMGALYFAMGTFTVENNFDVLDWRLVVFWALVLASGSLGNELIDRDADKKNKIKTLGNSLTIDKTKQLISVVQMLALANIIWISLELAMWFSLIASVCGFIFILISLFNRVNAPEPDLFRSQYRWTFGIVVLAFLFERGLQIW